MSEHEGKATPAPLPPAEDEERPIPIVGNVVKKSSRFSREFVATMISLAAAAFGVVAALAWNTAITALFNRVFPNEEGRITALFVYAVVVTLIGVLVIVLLGRLATRINAQPVEFKYPAVPKPPA
jgi:uncharacterized membrane protein YjjP (DUF1212 family)